MRRSIATICLLAIAVIGGAYAQAPAAPAAGQAATEPATGDRWPKTAQLDGATYTIYQPQLDSWDSFNLAAHAAVSVLPPGSEAPAFGVLKLTAKTKVDRLARTVYFTDTTVQAAIFPSAPNWAASYQQAFQALFVKGPLTVALDRVEAALAVLNAQNQAKSVPVQNPVPQFVFSTTPAVLVTVDGDPAWRKIAGTSYERVLNTRPLLLRDGSDTSISISSTDSSRRRDSPAHGRSQHSSHPTSQGRYRSWRGGAVDLMEGPVDEKTAKKPSLAAGAPGVIVVTKPTELIVTDGAPDWVGLDGTGSLLYAKNTDANRLSTWTRQPELRACERALVHDASVSKVRGVRRGQGSSGRVWQDPR